MANHDKYYTGSSVSRYLSPGERSFTQVVYQSGKPVLDSEMQLAQDIKRELSHILGNRRIPSGWLKGQSRRNLLSDFSFYASPSDIGFTANAFSMSKRTAVVNGWPVVVEYTNTDTEGQNLIQLETPPLFGGPPPDVKRTDFVFLEVFQVLISDSANATATVTLASNPSAGDTLTIDGILLTAVAGVPGVDQFTVGANAIATAANMVTAINDGANSFTATATAAANGTNIVTLTAVVSGTAGNLQTLATSVPATMVLSGPLFTGGTDSGNKPSQDTLYRHGDTQSSVTVALPDDLADPLIGVETAKRVQLQYRIRVTGSTEAINFKIQADGFSNTAVLAQGGQSAPVANYPFVPADLTSVDTNSSAVAFDIEDPGLWIAGDGSLTAAGDLGTCDGFVYAIPLCFVFRRNDSEAAGGFDPLNNTQGGALTTHAGFVNPQVGVIAAGVSDRPDGLFPDHIVSSDVLDLRKHVAPTGHDLEAELKYQMQSLLDNSLATWAIDTSDKQELGSGSGDVSTYFLVCNQIGRDGASGGVPPISGDTTRGPTIRNFDHVARRFGDSPIVERFTLALLPTDAIGTDPGRYVTQANGGYTGWAEDDEINIDLDTLNASTLGDFDIAGTTFAASVSNLWPPGTTITNILVSEHDDGHYTTAVSRDVQFKLIQGMGTPHVQLTLDRNDDAVNQGNPGNPTIRMVGDSGLDDGSPRRIFIEMEVTYPLGSGITDTPDIEVVPDASVYVDGPILENDTSQRPGDWEDLLTPRFREGKREVALEYVANEPGSGVASGTPITDNFISSNTSQVRFLRRVLGSGALLTGITDAVVAQPHDIDNAASEFGSSSRLITIDTSGGDPTRDPFSGTGQTEVDVTYFAQDAIPNYGAAGGGYQVGVYYRSTAPQTVGTMAGVLTTLPAPLTVEPLVMARWLWTGQVGSGSADIGYPYAAPLDQIAVNDDGSGSYPGDFYFAATAQITVDDFNAETGLLNLHSMVPMDGTVPLTFDDTNKDVEFRAHYRLSDPATYRPTMFAQPMSNVVRHKVFTPFLVRATDDTVLWRKGEVLLIVLSRFAELDDENTIRFTDTDNRTAAAVYRTRGLLLTVSDSE